MFRQRFFGVEREETTQTKVFSSLEFGLIVEQPIEIFNPDVVRSCLTVDHFTDEEKIDRHTITRRQVQWVDNFVIAKHIDGEVILLFNFGDRFERSRKWNVCKKKKKINQPEGCEWW